MDLHLVSTTHTLGKTLTPSPEMTPVTIQSNHHHIQQHQYHHHHVSPIVCTFPRLISDDNYFDTSIKDSFDDVSTCSNPPYTATKTLTFCSATVSESSSSCNECVLAQVDSANACSSSVDLKPNKDGIITVGSIPCLGFITETLTPSQNIPAPCIYSNPNNSSIVLDSLTCKDNIATVKSETSKKSSLDTKEASVEETKWECVPLLHSCSSNVSSAALDELSTASSWDSVAELPSLVVVPKVFNRGNAVFSIGRSHFNKRTSLLTPIKESVSATIDLPIIRKLDTVSEPLKRHSSEYDEAYIKAPITDETVYLPKNKFPEYNSDTDLINPKVHDTDVSKPNILLNNTVTDVSVKKSHVARKNHGDKKKLTKRKSAKSSNKPASPETLDTPAKGNQTTNSKYVSLSQSSPRKSRHRSKNSSVLFSAAASPTNLISLDVPKVSEPPREVSTHNNIDTNTRSSNSLLNLCSAKHDTVNVCAPQDANCLNALTDRFLYGSNNYAVVAPMACEFLRDHQLNVPTPQPQQHYTNSSVIPNSYSGTDNIPTTTQRNVTAAPASGATSQRSLRRNSSKTHSPGGVCKEEAKSLVVGMLRGLTEESIPVTCSKRAGGPGQVTHWNNVCLGYDDVPDRQPPRTDGSTALDKEPEKITVVRPVLDGLVSHQRDKCADNAANSSSQFGKSSLLLFLAIFNIF